MLNFNKNTNINEKLNESFRFGNGIYIYNKNTQEINYYCYCTNISNEELEALKKENIIIKLVNKKYSIMQ